jgi:hypothetical protein
MVFGRIIVKFSCKVKIKASIEIVINLLLALGIYSNLSFS